MFMSKISLLTSFLPKSYLLTLHDSSDVPNEEVKDSQGFEEHDGENGVNADRPTGRTLNTRN